MELEFVLGTVFAVLHAERSADDEEEFVFVVVVMPDEFALEFRELDVGIVEFADDLGTPRIREGCEFLGERDLLHGWKYGRKVAMLQEPTRAKPARMGHQPYVWWTGLGQADEGTKLFAGDCSLPPLLC